MNMNKIQIKIRIILFNLPIAYGAGIAAYYSHEMIMKAPDTIKYPVLSLVLGYASLKFSMIFIKKITRKEDFKMAVAHSSTRKKDDCYDK